MRKKFFNVSVLILIIINIKIPLCFGDYFHLCNHITSISSVVLLMICILDKEVRKIAVKPYLFINRFLACFFLFLVVELIYGYIGGTSFSNCLIVLYKYLWLFLFYPIVYMLKVAADDIRVLRNICIFSTIWLLFQTYVWWKFNFRGNDVFHYLLFHFNAGEWVRNGLQRLPGVAFLGMIFSFSVYLFVVEKVMLKKIFALSIIVFLLWYTLKVFQSRGQLISIFVTLFIVCFFIKENVILKFFIFMIAVFLLWYLFESEFILDFIHSFNDSSTRMRSLAVSYFLNLFLENFLLGCRVFMVSDYTGSFYFSDMGILSKFVEFGIIGGILFMFPFGRFFWIIFKTYKNEKKIIFYISLCVYTLISSFLSNDVYEPKWYLIAMPFILAYFEIMYEKNVRGRIL